MTPTTNPNPSATDREHPPYDVEIMSPGSFDFGPGQHFTFDEAAFDEMIRNFDTLQGKHDVPVRVQLGHDDHQVLDGQQSGDPSFGWAERLWKKGSGASARLMATIVGMPHALREAINRRGYRKVSLAAYSNWQNTEAERNLRSGVTGKVVQHIAFLGASIPRVRGLADLPRVLAHDPEADVLVAVESDPPPLATMAAPVVLAAADPAKPHIPGKSWLTRTERLDALERQLTELNARNRVRDRDWKATMTEPLTFSSFTPQQADQASGVKPLSTLFADELEAELQARGASRDNPAERAAAARATLLKWRSRPPSQNAPGADSAPSLADQIEPSEVSRAITSFNSTSVPITTTANATLPSYARSSDAATAANRIKQAPFEGVVSSTYGSWPTTMSEREDVAPRYGSRPGYGAGTLKAMHTLAGKRGLDMSRPADRDRAAALLFAEGGGVPLSKARSFEVALHAILRDRLGVRPELIQFAESEGKIAKATRILAAERPDLVDSYVSPKPPADGRAVAFSDAVDTELGNLDVLDPHRLSEATRRAAARYGRLIPDYGSVPRRV